MSCMLEASDSATLDPSPSGDTVSVSRTVLEQLQAEVKFKQAKIEALNFEIARLKRWRFGSSSESLDASTQAVLFGAIVADTRIEDEAEREERQRQAAPKPEPRRAVRSPLPANLPRIDHHYELEELNCACGQPLKRIGEDVSEQLDCVPAQFFVQRHIRGKYACACCQTIQAAALPAQIIDKGIPAPGLLAQVVIAKHDDHLPLYRQEEIYARSGVHIPRSSMAQWVGICGVRLAPLADALHQFILSHGVIHADETPVSLLAPGRGKTEARLHVGLPHHRLCGAARGVVRLHRQPRRRASPARAARLSRHARDRRLLGLSRACSAGGHRRALHGARPQETVRGAQAHRQRDRRPGGAADRQALRDRARGTRARPRSAPATTPAALQAGSRRLACLALGPAAQTRQGGRPRPRRSTTR